jgi:hypothetical protein
MNHDWKKVAVEGDVQATPGSTPFTGAASGTWKEGEITYSSYDYLNISGRKAIYKAQCKFTFTGTSPAPANNPIVGDETVTLEAQSTKLQRGLSNILVDGASSTGSTFGNTLQVKASHKLSTT